MPSNSTLWRAAGGVGLALLLAGCSSADYLNHRDRITLAGGDAVRRNLERETANPAKASMYDVTGLGADGAVIPKEAAPAKTAITLTAAPAP